MGGASRDDDFRSADTFAPRFEAPIGSEGWFEDQYGVAPARFLLDRGAGTLAADFFVGGPQKDQALLDRVADRQCRIFAGEL